jgi:hypothetical protein
VTSIIGVVALIMAQPLRFTVLNSVIELINVELRAEGG